MRSGIEQLAHLIDEVRVAMVTTVEPDGALHTRPLGTLQFEHNGALPGTLWFFTARDSPKVCELQHDRRVSAAYAHPSKNLYAAIAGTASVLRDRAKAQQLWHPLQRAFFPGGIDDPRLTLLRIEIERAEYWMNGGTAAQVIAVARAAVTGEPVEMRNNQKI